MLLQWHGFTEGKWTKEVNVRDFIQKNYTPYEGNAEFLTAPTEKTQQLWHKVLELMKQEREKGVLDVDTKVPTSIAAHAAGYIDRDLEQIVGLQTDRPLKRAIMPFGGIRVVKAGLEAYGYQLDRQTEEIFTKYRKTHNDGVFDVYTRSMRLARRSGIITGLPDAYGRGRIIGDYRRVALYGVDRLIDDKKTQQESLELDAMDEATIRLREELSEQIRALFELKEMAASYGFDIGRPAANALLSCPMGVFWLLGSSERTKRGSDVSRSRIDVFRHLFRARFAKWGEFRTRIARTDRPFCNETPHGAVFANSRL